jgi:hypothetical protein
MSAPVYYNLFFRHCKEARSNRAMKRKSLLSALGFELSALKAMTVFNSLFHSLVCKVLRFRQRCLLLSSHPLLNHETEMTEQ